MRTIIFGDIHGCHREWSDLMDKAEVKAQDRLFSVGDLVAKGPSNRKTLDLAMSLPNLKCVKGNHEWALVRRWKAGTLDEASDDHRKVVRDLGDDFDRYLEFIDSWPLYIELPECLVVHAGLRPGIPLDRQTEADLVSIRTIEPGGEPWFESYTESRLIVHGHWAANGLVIRDNVIGLDTGCVYGKKLSALILPERKILSVRAHKAYKDID